VLEFNFNWDKLSAIAGLTWRNFYFRFYEGSITSERVIEFLGHLQRHVPGKLLIVWDGASIHRSKLIREYSTRWSISGVIGNSMNCPTCAPVTSGNSPAGPPMASAAFAANAIVLSPLSGSRPNFGLNVRLYREDQ
jgi:hypothetical protein